MDDKEILTRFLEMEELEQQIFFLRCSNVSTSEIEKILFLDTKTIYDILKSATSLMVIDPSIRGDDELQQICCTIRGNVDYGDIGLGNV